MIPQTSRSICQTCKKLYWRLPADADYSTAKYWPGAKCYWTAVGLSTGLVLASSFPSCCLKDKTKQRILVFATPRHNICSENMHEMCHIPAPTCGHPQISGQTTNPGCLADSERAHAQSPHGSLHPTRRAKRPAAIAKIWTMWTSYIGPFTACETFFNFGMLRQLHGGGVGLGCHTSHACSCRKYCGGLWQAQGCAAKSASCRQHHGEDKASKRRIGSPATVQ